MNNNNPKIVVLTHLNSSSEMVMTNAINVAKLIGAQLEVFHVKKPSEIVNSDSQLSALRTINESSLQIDKKMKAFLDPFKGEGVAIKQSFMIGNVKNEIENYINERDPELIVMGKRKASTFKLLGDGLTEFLLNSYKGMVLIAGSANMLKNAMSLKLGAYNVSKDELEQGFAKTLMEKSNNPVRSFKVVEKPDAKQMSAESNISGVVEYVFEQNDNVVNNISNYVAKNELDLLFVDRPSNSDNSNSVTKVKSLLKNNEVAVLFPGHNKFNLN